MATHLAVGSAHKHGPSEGLDDNGSPAGPLVGQAGPLHAVLLLEHHSCPGLPQVFGQPEVVGTDHRQCKREHWPAGRRL
jgi:hypothetical protein